MIFRVHRKDRRFTVIDKVLLERPDLSLRAKGLMAVLLSRPDDWEVRSHELAGLGPDGRDAVRGALRELEDARYIKREKKQNPDTGRWATITHVYEDPSLLVSVDNLLPGPGYPSSVRPAETDITAGGTEAWESDGRVRVASTEEVVLKEQESITERTERLLLEEFDKKSKRA